MNSLVKNAETLPSVRRAVSPALAEDQLKRLEGPSYELTREAWRAGLDGLGRGERAEATPRSLAAAEEVFKIAHLEPELRRFSEDLASALSAKPNANATRAAAAILIDAYKFQPSSPGAFMEALVYDLTALGFGPAIVAKALQGLRRSSANLPSIAEIIPACSAVRKGWEAQLGRTNDLLDYIKIARKVRALPLAKSPARPTAEYRREGAAAW